MPATALKRSPLTPSGVPSQLYKRVKYSPRGGVLEAFYAREPEILLVGAAGTGKSRGALERLHLLAHKYDGMRGLITRKTRTSLTQSAMRTFSERVLDDLDGVRFHTGKQAYLYPNGSEIAVGGMDKSIKVMSAEYDIIYAQEATELTESDWEALTSRLRFGRMPFQQLMGDCNPDSPNHWLLNRYRRGILRTIPTHFEDNPSITPEYLEKLKSLTGVRYRRLYLGEWAAAEGQVYEEWDSTIHIVDHTPPARSIKQIVAGVDWGFTNPGVILLAAVDQWGRATIFREIYMAGKTIEWWVEKAQRMQARYRVDRWICDPAEPAFIMAFKSAGMPATEGYNRIGPGISAVQDMLKVRDHDIDGMKVSFPHLQFNRSAIWPTEVDRTREEERKTIRTTDEIPGYVWDRTAGKRKGEQPLPGEDHGCDALRYLCAYLSNVGKMNARRDIRF